MMERAQERAYVRAWAQEVLADPSTVILDTETTGLDGYIVQIGVIDVQGAILLDTLVNPQCEIEPGAQAVHGITAKMVVNAPTFAEIVPCLSKVLAGKRVVIYNAVFDVGILRNELLRCYPDQDPAYWLGCARWECAMKMYAIHVGEPGRFGSYRWQRLQGGDHSAVGDCRAALDVIKRMAAE